VFGSLEIGSLFGVRVRVHLLLLAMGGLFLLDPGLGGLLGFGVLCLAVFLHELGHALTARRLGLEVVDITLGPLGGMTRMSVMPESSRIEAWVASAGPLTNLALAALCAVAALTLPVAAWPPWATLALAQGLTFNLVLGLFNLVPAFPTDGGRLLRAWLARRRDWLRATEIAVRVGAWCALLAASAGFALVFSGTALAPQGLALVLVAAFVWWTGKQELAQVRLRHGVASPFEVLAAVLRGPLGSAPPAPAAREAEAGAGLSRDAIEDLERHRGSLSSWRSRREPDGE